MSQIPATGSQQLHITRVAEVFGGKPCIAGTRIRVQDVYTWHELQGQSPDEIVSRFPQLTLADVYAALAYFWDHREQVLGEIREDDGLAERLRAEFPSRLDGRVKPLGNGDAVPP